ncbi:TATA-box-binding protein [Halobacterium litoreum]|uniref:TATA-box-binding protein n=1 Tax=Halobacterium litoreum TaxID=2039234 RepID=A0ABD5NF71_9EURY|nr:TATA-box-binding protein C [Halobacterium litoreum]UHH13198.1 TATA-box-binding protein C [Halobacterium litoreum]
MVEIVNVVGSGDLGIEIDLQELAADIPLAEYDDSHRPAPPTIQMRTGNSLILVYRTGTYAIRGGESIEDIEEARDHLLSILVDLSLIEDINDPNFAIRNVVCVGNLDQDIDLNAMVVRLGFEDTEYEPEQFPGLVYRPEYTNCVLLIFASGKVVITGGRSKKDAEMAFESLQAEIETF